MKVLAWAACAIIQTAFLKLNVFQPFQEFAHQTHVWAVEYILSLRSPLNWFYAAILVGEDQGIKGHAEIQSFLVLGLYHLIVVSGSHVRALEVLVSKITRQCPEIVKSSITLSVLILFSLVNDLQASCMRALIQWIILKKIKLENPLRSPDLQLLVTCVSLILEPAWVKSISFQLSCAATLGLAIASEFDARHSLAARLLTSLSCTIVTAPLVFNFQPCLSWLVIPANTIALPLFESILMPASLITVALPFLKAATEFLLHLVFSTGAILADHQNPYLCFDERRPGAWGFLYLASVYAVWRLLLPYVTRALFLKRQLKNLS